MAIPEKTTATKELLRDQKNSQEEGNVPTNGSFWKKNNWEKP